MTEPDNTIDVLRAELDQVRAHDRDVTNLTVDQQVEIGRLWEALRAHHRHLAEWANCDVCRMPDREIGR